MVSRGKPKWAILVVVLGVIWSTRLQGRTWSRKVVYLHVMDRLGALGYKGALGPVM